MTNTIETYLDSLSEDISILNINFKKLLTLNMISKGIKSLPDLTRFKNLIELNCSDNKLRFYSEQFSSPCYIFVTK